MESGVINWYLVIWYLVSDFRVLSAENWLLNAMY